MGVLVFILALLPMKGGSVMNLMKAESPGPTVSKFVPRVRGTAKILYQIYLGMTLFTIAALLLSGMKTFDGCCRNRRLCRVEQRLCSVHTTAAVDSDNRHDCVRCEF